MSDQIAAIDESYPERDLRIGLWACIVVPLAFGMLSLALGQDANWDLKNYHWYNPYAFLTERWAQDIAPAHVPTFYNPTLDVPFALLAEAVPARVAGFVLGLAQGLNFVLLYVLAHMVLARAFAQGAQLWAVAIALVGMVGGGHLGLVGTTFYDNIVSLFILGSLCITIAGRSWEA
ncbi:MAG: hypothetical protein SFV19_07780, partial [Rhodospirillaceae bacterium]|nr:hypothetical protein [Rhodospirillaceae bacterium]